MSSIEWTRVLLGRWGRWARGGVSTGLPRASAFVHAGSGARGADGNTYIPPDIEQIDKLVNSLRPSYKAVLIQKYTKQGPAWLKAQHLLISRTTYFTRVIEAEKRVTLKLNEGN